MAPETSIFRMELPYLTIPDLTPHHLEEDVLERSKTVPSAWYVHPAYHDLDRKYVFSRSWQYMCSLRQLSKPGDYVTDTIAGNPIIVVRDKENDLKAYYNVCKHRGGPLAMDACGHSSVLQCKYHGWTYLLDGSLRGVPRFDRTELFDKKDFGLSAIAVRDWQGMVFVCLEPEFAPPFEEVVAGISERISPIDLSSLLYHKRDLYSIKSNWKVYVDNYLEGYHIPLVHPDLMSVLDFRSYKTETEQYHSLQFSPLKDGDHTYGSSADQAFYYFIFPNMMLNIMPGRLQVNRVDAHALDACSTVFDYYYDSIEESDIEGRIASDLSFSDLVQAEDIEICEHVHRGLASNAYDQGRFSYDLEGGVHHFQQCLKRSYRAALNDLSAT
jgi:choline monooxygenase